MKPGFCANCETRVIRYTANGHPILDPYKYRLLTLWYRYLDGRQEITQVHVPVCDKCVSNPNLEVIENFLKGDASYESWRTLAPEDTTEFVSFQEYPLIDRRVVKPRGTGV